MVHCHCDVIQRAVAAFEVGGVGLSGGTGGSDRNLDRGAIGELATIKAQLDEITAERETLTASLAEAQSKVAELEASIVEASTSAEARAAEIVAQAGIAPLDVASDEQLEELNTEQLRAKIEAIADPKARLEARLKNWDKLNSH